LSDIAGLGACPWAGHQPDPWVDPPAHAVVLSIDEKSQIQALDRTQLGLPIKPGRCQTMKHDYKRHGTTTLFATLSVLDGTVIGGCMQRHRHIETRCRKADCRPTRWSRRLEQLSISRRYSATLARYRYRADRIR
jgi:hypothetical protein